MPAGVRGLLTTAVVGLSMAAAGCRSSVLIRPDDPAFARAQGRLAQTTAQVDSQGGPLPERVLVLQAEGFYRYRFQPPRRGFLGYAAQFAASAIEISALQSVSEALDIYDLRLRTSDAAVQLWETYLSRFPDGAYRPLVLYRLGWAYRSAAAAGFPRASGNDAFAQLRREFPDSPLLPLAADALKLPWKSKSVATAWSVVPGLGQMYVGATGRGTVHLLVGLAAVAMIAAPTVAAFQRRHDLTWGHDWPLLVVGAGGLLVLSLDYTAAYQDALQRVVEWNDRLQDGFEDAHRDAP